MATAKGVLIQVNPQVRLPRTFRRFCGLFVQLLQKLSIRASNGPDKLLKAREGPPAAASQHGTRSAAAPGAPPCARWHAMSQRLIWLERPCPPAPSIWVAGSALKGAGTLEAARPAPADCC